MSVPPAEVAMLAWVPLLPILRIPYLLQVVASYALAMYIDHRTRRRAVVRAYFLALAMVFTCWLIAPTQMLRQATPPGWWNRPYAVVPVRERG